MTVKNAPKFMYRSVNCITVVTVPLNMDNKKSKKLCTSHISFKSTINAKFLKPFAYSYSEMLVNNKTLFNNEILFNTKLLFDRKTLFNNEILHFIFQI